MDCINLLNEKLCDSERILEAILSWEHLKIQVKEWVDNQIHLKYHIDPVLFYQGLQHGYMKKKINFTFKSEQFIVTKQSKAI